MTPDYRLRPLGPADAEELHAVVSHWSVVRQLGRWPWPPDRAFTESRCRPFEGDGSVWGIEVGGRILGSVGLVVRDGQMGLGYMLSPALHGKGLMTRVCADAMRAFLWDVRERWGVTGMAADHYADNPASGAVLRKLGFRPTGRTVMDTGAARLEPAPCLIYRLDTADLERPS